MKEIDGMVMGSKLTPRISAVRAVGSDTIQVSWLEGSRSGEVESVNLSPLIDGFKFYAPLRKNKKLFSTVHVTNNGFSIAWGDDDLIDMASTSIARLADEAMTGREFEEFLRRNRLTHEAAAAVLGRSRRMVEYYLSTGAVPRIVALACYGYEARYAVQFWDKSKI